MKFCFFTKSIRLVERLFVEKDNFNAHYVLLMLLWQLCAEKLRGELVICENTNKN